MFTEKSSGIIFIKYLFIILLIHAADNFKIRHSNAINIDIE